MNLSQRRQELLRKFAEDICTPAEAKELLGYLQQPGYRDEYADVLRDLWNQVPTDQALDQDRSQVILENILRHEASPNKKSLTLRSWSWVYRVAAAFIGILLVAAVSFLYLREETIRYETAYGQLRVIVLPDSSRVTLNGNSTLRYQADWEALPIGNTREVWLEGEGFFEVTEVVLSAQSMAKFVVHTPQLDVEVVGTKFNVTNRRHQTQVVLSSGQVKLHERGREEEIPGGDPTASAKGQRTGRLISGWLSNHR